MKKRLFSELYNRKRKILYEKIMDFDVYRTVPDDY